MNADSAGYIRIDFVCLFVCLFNCLCDFGFSFPITVMVISGHCLHFMGLLPNIWMCLKMLQLRLTCMDGLFTYFGGQPVIKWSVSRI